MSHPLTCLVVGGTGLVGARVARMLRENGARVRLLARTRSGRALALEQIGCEVFEGDLRQPDTLAAALAGTEVVISTASATMSQTPGDTVDSVDRDGNLALVARAEAADVKRFVFVSFPEQVEDFPLQSAKRALERRLLGSTALTAVVLRSTFLMDVWLSPPLGFDYVDRRVRLYGSGEA